LTFIIITTAAAGSNTKEARMDQRVKGKVLWYNEARGYGFLSKGEGDDIFVHHSALSAEENASLTPGKDVEFNIVLGPKGIQAADVIELS
jgi:CspA family cold shock protein